MGVRLIEGINTLCLRLKSIKKWDPLIVWIPIKEPTRIPSRRVIENFLFIPSTRIPLIDGNIGPT